MRHTRLVIVAFAASFAACASDYGGSISGKDVLSPEERRLQAVESRVAVLQRRLDAVNLTGLDEQSQHLRDDMRSLRGDVEKLRYDADQLQQRDQAIEARLQRLEGGAVAAPQAGYGAAPAAGGYATPAAPAAAPAATYGAPTAPGATDSNSIPVVTPAQTPSAPAGATLSQGSGPSPEEEAAYLGAFEALKNGKYDDALKGFRGQLQKWPQGQYADNALYWSGEAYYIKGDYKSALAAFQAVLDRFPRSAKRPDAMLKTGLVQMDLKQDAEGRATLQRVIKTYPGSNAANLAQQRLQPGKK
ncbi:MAG TPA: tol-pal system protein YbgF [Solimonas sp.]|jgi:tol-pal system protein YbgF|nr:tol-pal system protein YbgF [Solimonas sp.]